MILSEGDRRRVGRSDVAAALAAAVCDAAAVLVGQGADHLPGGHLTAVLAAAAFASLLLFRRRWPLTVLVLSLLGNALANLSAQIMLAVYSATLYSRRPLLVLPLGLLCLAPSVYQSFLWRPDSAVEETFYTLMSLIALGTVGHLVRLLITERTAILRQEAELRGEEARAEERAELAREMHDSVAHHVTLMVISASSLEAARPTDPNVTAGLAERIRLEGNKALTELRDLVGVLHERSEGRRGRRLSDLSVLLCTARETGLDITTVTSGPSLHLSEAGEHAAFRLVQEGLTNAAKHAPGAAISVGLTYGSQALEVVVHNGPGRSERRTITGGGHGLAGIRQRVEAQGGTFTAGPDQGGFTVSAVLPAVRP